MRLKAREELTYAGKTWQSGSLFDALERDGRTLVNQGLAEPFGLEDPSMRSVEDIIENLKPLEPPPPAAPVTVLPTSVQIQPAAGASSFNVVMTDTGSWTASTTDSWLQIDSPTTPQTTSGTVSFSAQANNGIVGEPAANRTGTVQVNDAVFTVTQTPWDVLPVELIPTEATSDAGGGPGSFNVTITGSGTSGTWTVDIENAARTWLTVDSPTTPQSVDGPVMYSVWTNSATERIGKLFINGQPFTVTQAGV